MEVAAHVHVPPDGPEAGSLVQRDRIVETLLRERLDESLQLGGLGRQNLLGPGEPPVEDGTPDALPAVGGMGDAPQEDPARGRGRGVVRGP